MEEDEDICRVCRSNGSPDKPLFHPCICTGSIRHVHQECLIQWLQHSRKEYCELCNYKYSFKPIYSPDMPKRLPIRDLLFGLLASISSAVKCWIHYTLVAIAWLGIVPLTASRIFNCVFAGSVSALTSLPRDMLSTESIGRDVIHGCAIVACTLSAFICLIWLRVQVLNGDLPAWLLLRPEEEIQGEINNNANADENQPQDVEENNGNEFEAFPNDAPNENPAAVNWNVVEWDRDGDDPSWERILGLDGSFLFIEHVFWVVALNTLFILVFAFCPYHLGHFFLFFVDLHSYVIATKFEGVLTTLCGYVLVACSFLLCHILLQVAKFHWPGRIFGLCYIILKVGLLVLVEIGVFPLLCGIWLDICTLKIFNSTLDLRQEIYFRSPGVSIFLHWAVGMIFVFYLANFLMLAKEVLRPGALWFLRNLNDPDFNPINEMIHLSIYKYCRRFILSIVIFGSTIVVIAWVPIHVLIAIAPNFLPFNAVMKTSLVGEFCLQILVMQFTVPGLLEHNATKALMKTIICSWAHIFGTLLGIRSYLLTSSDQARNENQDEVRNDHENDVGNVHADGHLDDNFDQQQAYEKPPFFGVRILLLLVSVAGTFSFFSFWLLVIPVLIGRLAIKFIFGHSAIPLSLSENSVFYVHETYTFLLGVYLCWTCYRLYWAMTTWIPRGWDNIKQKVVDCGIIMSKCIALAIYFLCALPVLIGLLVDLVVLIPLTVPLHETPVIVLWQDWAVGLLVQTLLVAILTVGPQTWVKDQIEQAYDIGIRNLSLLNFFRDTLLPIIGVTLACLCLPYAIGHSIPVFFSCDLKTEYLFKWRMFPLLLTGANVIGFCWYEIKQFNRLCDHIKNERYLIGRRLQDYNP